MTEIERHKLKLANNEKAFDIFMRTKSLSETTNAMGIKTKHCVARRIYDHARRIGFPVEKVSAMLEDCDGRKSSVGKPKFKDMQTALNYIENLESELERLRKILGLK